MPETHTEKAPPQPRPARDAWVVAACSLAALILSAWALHARGVVDYDETYYYILGRSLVTRNGYALNGLPHAAFPPLYPILVGIASLFTANVRLATSLVSALSAAALPVPVFFLARSVHSRRAALAAAAAAAVWPALFFFAAVGVPYRERLYAGSEPLFLTLLAAGICVLWLAARRQRLLFCAGAGVFFGLAALTRNEGATLFGACLLWFAADRVFLGAGKHARRAAQTALVALAFLITVSPFLIYVHGKTGAWGLSSKLSNFVRVREALWQWIDGNDGSGYVEIHYALNEDATQMADDYWGVTPWHVQATSHPDNLGGAAWLISHPDWRWLSVFWNALVLWNVPVIWPYAWPVILIGVAARGWSKARLSFVLLFAAVLAALLAQTVAIFVLGRFLLPLVIFAAIPFGAGLEALGRIAALIAGGVTRRQLRERIAYCAVAVVLLGAMAADGCRLNLRGNRDVPTPGAISSSRNDLMVAANLREELPPGSTLMTNKPWIAVLAGLDWRVSPSDTAERIAHYAKSARIDYALLGKWQVERPVPGTPLYPYFAQRIDMRGEAFYLFDFGRAETGGQPPE